MRRTAGRSPGVRSRSVSASCVSMDGAPACLAAYVYVYAYRVDGGGCGRLPLAPAAYRARVRQAVRCGQCTHCGGGDVNG